MAENINITPGAGAVIAADQITDPTLGTALVTFGKIVDGTLGGTNKLVVSPTGAAKVDTSWYSQAITGAVNVSQSGVWQTTASIVGTPNVNASIQGTIPVSGNFYQANQPVTASIIGTLPVSGTFWQANQPVSASIIGIPTVNQGTNPWLTNASIVGTPGVTASIAGSVPVTGSFWQANQPVTASIAGTVPVSGAFNVSLLAPITVTLAGNVSIGAISVTANSAPTITALQGNAPWLENVSIQGTVPVSGTFWQANQPVTASVIGTIPVSGTFYQVNQPVTASISGTVPVSGAFNVSLQGVVATKNTTAPTSAVQIGMSDGTNLQAPQTAAGDAVSPWLIAESVGGLYNGSTVDRWRGNASLGAQVQVMSAITLAGNVSIGSLTVSSNSSITAFQGGAPWLNNVSIIGTIPVSGTFYQANQPVTASVIGTIPVSGTFYQANQPVTASISGTVPVSGFPTAVNVSLLAPATVTLSGSITVGAHNVSLVGLPDVNISDPNGTNALVNASGALYVAPYPGATINAIQNGVWAVNASILAPITVTLGGVNLNPAAYGGWTSKAFSALSSTTTISAAAGKFGGYMLMNTATAPAYLQLFDASAAVSLGLNYTMLLPLPANGTAANGIAANFELTNGAALATGLKAAVTTGANASIIATPLVGTIWYR